MPGQGCWGPLVVDRGVEDPKHGPWAGLDWAGLGCSYCKARPAKLFATESRRVRKEESAEA